MSPDSAFFSIIERATTFATLNGALFRDTIFPCGNINNLNKTDSIMSHLVQPRGTPTSGWTAS